MSKYFLVSATEVREATRFKNADQKKKDAKSGPGAFFM